MIPIDCKITNFSLYLFACLLNRYNIIISWHAPNKLFSGKSVSQYASYSLIFSPLRSVINREQHKKHLYNQSSYYGKYGIYDHHSAHPSY